MKKVVVLFLSFFLLGIMGAMAQTRTISGKVTGSDDNSPIPGVSVIVKGTTLGTVTNMDGNFTLQVPQDATTLMFSFVGYRTIEASITGLNTVNVVLPIDVFAVDEVVVTGLGTATDKRKVAISVETVGEKELNSVPNLSIDGALIGRIAGAQIQSTSGQPGQQANIILRGINTLSTTQPMILIDGVEVSSSNNTMGTGNVSSRLTDLDMSNIERVEVVQGAAAATIYGAQGANGVIHIFTKRGKKGQKTDIRLASTYSVDNALRGNLEFAEFHYYPTDASGYIMGSNGVRSAPNPVTGFWNMPAPGFDATTKNNKPFVNQTYDHMDQYFVKNAATMNNSLNITGAANNIDFAFGLSNMSQESVVFGELSRYNLTSNIGAELFKGFTLRSNTQLVNSTNTTGGINNRNNIYSGISNALMVPQFVDLMWVNENGDPPVIHDQTSNSINPFYAYKYRTYEADVNRIIQGVNANYKINKFVELDYKYGIDHYRYDYETFIKNQRKTPAPGMGISPIDGQLVRRRIQETQQNSIISAIAKLNFDDDLKLGVPIASTTQLVYDWRKNDYHRIDAIGTGFEVDPPHTLNFAATTDADEYISEFITFGYLINQKFDYGMLGGFSVGFRSDFSSEFGEASKPFNFPRADAYLRLSELLKTDYIYEFKLRAAYGEAGVQPGRYERQITVESATLGNSTYLALPAISRNPALSVENTKEFEVGVDYGFKLGNGSYLDKLSGSVVYWQRNSYGTIYQIDLPPSTGAAGILTNAIDLLSDGLQISLDLNVVSTNAVDWKFGTRFSKGSTLVDKISNGQPIVIGTGGSGQWTIREGEPVGALFGLETLSSLTQTNSKGVRYISEANIANYEVVEGMVVNKTTKQVEFTTEQVKIGDATPKFSMSFFNDLTIFKNLTATVQLDWVHGAQAYNQSRQWLYRDRLHKDFDREVTINGETGAFVNFWSSLYKTNMANNYYVEDASYIRLRNVGLTYDFSKLINSSLVKGCVLGISGRNLFTISDYTGIDPEATGTNVNNPLNRGVDLWTFPNMKTYSVSLNLNF
jgi:TonB-dependent starch-binding outer membrane protein SusC